MPHKSMSAILRRLEAQGIQPTALDVLAAAEAGIQPPRQIRCLNPECLNFVTWKKTRGRPQRYCSRACNKKQKKTRDRLLRQLEAMESYLASHPDMLTVDKRFLSSQIAQHRWALRHYPGVVLPKPAEGHDSHSEEEPSSSRDESLGAGQQHP